MAVQKARSCDCSARARAILDPIYAGDSAWRLLPAFDHPTDPAHCLVTGTGLTHRASADNREFALRNGALSLARSTLAPPPALLLPERRLP